MSYAKLDVVKSYLEKMDRDYRPKKILHDEKLRFTKKVNNIVSEKPYSKIPDMKNYVHKKDLPCMSNYIHKNDISSSSIPTPQHARAPIPY